jgi:lipoate-protein ligase A
MTSQHRPWAFHHWHGNASDFHAMSLDAGRGLWWCSVNAPAVILGSTQSDSDINGDRAQERDLAVVHRRSGGGIVYVHPTDSLWIDVTIPRDDPLWNDDVSLSMLWLGEVFVDALQPWLTTSVYRGAFDRGSDGRLVCFASTSPGEVFVGDKKVVGISQRRTREGARFQCVLYRHWRPNEWVDVLRDDVAAQRILQLPVQCVNAESNEIVDSLRSQLDRA